MVKSIALLLPINVTLLWALVFLLQKRTNIKANRTLGLFMITATTLYICHAIFFHQLYHLYSFIDSIYILTLLSLYPLFYAYVLLVSNQQINVRRYLINFVPAIFLGVFSLVLNFILNETERIFYVKEVLISRNLKDFELGTILGVKGIIFLLARIGFISQALIYLLLGIRQVNRYNKHINDFYSNTEGRRMYWFRNISVIILIVSMSGIALALIGRTYFTHHPLLLLIPSVVFSTIYFLIGFYGNQQEIPNHDFRIDEDKTELEIMGSKQEESLKSKLISLFEKEHIYRQTDLRITTISEALQTNRTYISRLINDEFGMNFNEFVNQYRVREAQKLLLSEKHNAYTLDYIAETVGFGSGNSFTRAFKEYKGITPSQFRAKTKLKLQVS